MKNKKENPIQPGLILKEVIEGYKMSMGQFALKSQIYPTQLSQIITGKRKINSDIALKLEKTTAYSAEYWMQIQNDYSLFIMRNKL
jgi:addiction module HigA family antidote